MEAIDTLCLKDTKEDLEKAAEIIKNGGLVAFPTETVYGLGADGTNPEAVKKIYEAKGRPSDNPTIVHIADKEDLDNLTTLVSKDMRILMDAFWPGPLTMVITKPDEIPYVTTGNLETVGVRMPENKIARDFIRASGTSIAAPSANISGRPSPTTAQHVMDDLGGRIDAIIQGGECKIGIESTVVDMTGEIPMILRPGYITKEDIERVLRKPILIDPTLNRKPSKDGNFKPKAPGMKYKHYAPNADMIIFRGDPEHVAASIDKERIEREGLGQNVYIISFDPNKPVLAAHEIFAQLRAADKGKADVILAAALPQKGLGFAVMNRMLKSAGFNIVEV